MKRGQLTMNCLASWVVFWSVSVPAGSPPSVPGASGPSSLHGGVLKASLQQFLAYGDPDQECGGTSRGDGKVSHMSVIVISLPLETKTNFTVAYLRLPLIATFYSCHVAIYRNHNSKVNLHAKCLCHTTQWQKQEELYCAWCGVWVLLKWGWFVVHVQSGNTYLSEVTKLVVECPGLFTL